MMARNTLSDTLDRRAPTDDDAEQARMDLALDEALKETFPASDPVAIHVDRLDAPPDRSPR
jgi:hypothetical protein